MTKYTRTSRYVQRRLRRMWKAGKSPVDMMRYLYACDYEPSDVAVALEDALGVAHVDQRYAMSWREDGTGVSDDLANQVLTTSIRNAGRARELAGERPIDDDFLDGPRQAAALEVLYGMWQRGQHGSTEDMVRWLRVCGITGDMIEEAFHRVFARKLLYQRFSGGAWIDGTPEYLLGERLSRALADAEVEVIAHPLPDFTSDDANEARWTQLACQGQSPILAPDTRRVLRAMQRSGVMPTYMLELLYARGLSPEGAAAAFGDTFALGDPAVELALRWLTREPLGQLETSRVLAQAIDAATQAAGTSASAAPSRPDRELLLQLVDGSRIFRATDTLQLDVDPGFASIVIACANDAVAAPAHEALVWYHGSGSGMQLAADQLEISGARGRAAISLSDFRTVLAAVYAERLSHESSWLFRPDPLACLPSDGDRMFAAELDSRQAAFEAALTSGQLDDIRASARRRIILAELRAFALVDEPMLARKIEVLDELGCARLGSLATAARDLIAYYASSERASNVASPPPSVIHEGVFSLDWARSVKSPPGITQYSVWCACENSFLSSPPTEDTGSRVVSMGSLRAHVYWRVEDGSRRMLYTASLSGA